jgi:hypothetical protein
MPLAEIHKGFQLMADGDVVGKVIVHPTDPKEHT